MSLLEDLGKKNGKAELPSVHVGDTVRVQYLIKEGDKERVQAYTGIVIALQGRGIARNVIVRRIVQGEGVERTFPLHSPRVKDIVLVRRGKVRRAKLYYLRDRVGKQTRVEELLGDKARREEVETEGAATEVAPPAQANETVGV